MDNHHAHTIRLNSAWEPPQAGARAWVRSFGKPSGITAGDRVILVIARPTAADIVLNAASLPPTVAGAIRWTHDITPLLRDRNLLEVCPEAMDTHDSHAIDAHGRASLPERFGRVTLEILTRATIER